MRANPFINISKLFLKRIGKSANICFCTALVYLLFGLSTLAYSQQTAEYFIDIDPGFGQAEPILLDSNFEAELVLNLAEMNLYAGMHQIGIRLQNDSLQWGLTNYRNFYVPNRVLNLSENNALQAVNYQLISGNNELMQNQWLFDSAKDSLEVVLNLPKNEGFFTLNVRAEDSKGRQSFQQKAHIYLPNSPLQQQKLDSLEISQFSVQSKGSSWLFGITDSLEADSLLALSEFEPGLQQLYATPISTTQEAAFSGFLNFNLGEDLFLPKIEAIYPTDSTIYVPIDSTLQWQEVEGALQYSLQFAEQPSSLAVVADTNLGLTTEFDLASFSLTKGSTYFWRVRALGDRVNSPWLPWQSFTTKRQIPEPTVLLSPENDSVQVLVTPTFSWQKNERARSYQLQLSLDSLFQNESVLDTLGIADTVWFYSDSLAFNTIHYWRVRAENESGTSDWSAVQPFRTQKAPPIQPVLAIPENGFTNTTASLNLRWVASDFAENYDVQLANTPSFQTTVAVFNNVKDTTVSIQNLAFFTNYYWRVRSVNATTKSEWSTTFSFKTRPFIAPLATVPAVSALSASPDVNESSAYRLISLPGNYEQLAVSSVFNDIGEINDIWMVYSDNGAEENYLISQQNQPQFFEPGKALWYLTKEAVPLDYSFAAPKINDQFEVAIPLRAGWNLIGSPFNQENYPWSVVRQTNNIAQPIWDFQGRWLQAQTLEAMKGYYFFNELGLDSLRLPLVGLSVTNKTSLNSGLIELVQDSVISLSISTDAGRENTSTIQWNFARNSADIPMPMQDFDEQSLWIEQKLLVEENGIKATKRSSFLWQKSIFNINENELANIEASKSMLVLEANYEGVIASKSFMSSKLGKNLTAAYLKNRGVSHVLVEFSPSEKRELVSLSELANLEVIIPDRAGKITLKFGSENDLNSYLDLQLPTEFEIAKIYPNPFNPTTNIVLNLPEEELIRLQVYDISGRLVATLLEQSLAAGSHQIPWNASGFATGVYWVKVQAQGTSRQAVQKITLLR